MISLRQIRYFVAVAKSGSFSAAAQIAHVSQPSLCVQMKQLEQEIGAKLLSRHARGIELTAAGGGEGGGGGGGGFSRGWARRSQRDQTRGGSCRRAECCACR